MYIDIFLTIIHKKFIKIPILIVSKSLIWHAHNVQIYKHTCTSSIYQCIPILQRPWQFIAPASYACIHTYIPNVCTLVVVAFRVRVRIRSFCHLCLLVSVYRHFRFAPMIRFCCCCLFTYPIRRRRRRV